MPNPNPSADFRSPVFTQALAAVRPELDRMPAVEVEDVRLDVPAAILAILGIVPKVATFRPAMLARFGEAQTANLDRLELVARAAGCAHADHQIEVNGADLEPLSNAVVELRAVLLVDAQSLVHRKVLQPGVLGELRGIQGAKNQCFDLLQLVSVFRKFWATVEAQTPVTTADLDRAEVLANQLATAAGIREQATAGVSPSADLRRRAFTLLLRTYDEVRRMITFLRWDDGDADQLAPSLWAGRRRNGSDITPAPTTTTTPTTNGQNGAAPIAPGLPGSSPFAPS